MKVVHFDVHADSSKDLSQVAAKFPGVEYVLVRDPADLAVHLPPARAMIANNRSYTPDNAALIRQHGKSLQWIQFSTSGIDKARSSGFPPGVTVTNAAGLRAFAVAEHAISLILGLYRNVRFTERARDRREWIRDEITPRCDNIAGKHALVIGVGAIGQEIARKLKAFDATVTGITRATDPLPDFDALRPRTDLVAAAAEADIVIMAAVHDDTTDKMASRAMFAAMKPTAIFVNIARGKLVDEPAMIEALRKGAIRGAGLDVMDTEPLPADNPLWTMDNVVMAPHIGGAGGKNPSGGFGNIFADNLARFLEGKPLQKVVIART
ncbi:MAG: hypothetical protein RLZ98_3012 [Pseudomonadota bacterium]|jgi:phosphoglycerate dehydrogenase-like enzyme